MSTEIFQKIFKNIQKILTTIYLNQKESGDEMKWTEAVLKMMADSNATFYKNPLVKTENSLTLEPLEIYRIKNLVLESKFRTGVWTKVDTFQSKDNDDWVEISPWKEVKWWQCFEWAANNPTTAFKIIDPSVNEPFYQTFNQNNKSLIFNGENYKLTYFIKVGI